MRAVNGDRLLQVENELPIKSVATWFPAKPIPTRFLNTAGDVSERKSGQTIFAEFKWAFAPTMSVIGSYSLTQQLSSGSLRWFRCASSAGSEKPEEAKRRPL